MFYRHDVAVIGAGVFGSWIASRFAQAGKRVVLVDAYGAGNPRSTSGCRSRVIRMAYGANEVYTRFAHQSLPAWKQLGHDLFIRTGVLWLAMESNERLQSSRATMQRFGIGFEDLDSSELERRYPQMMVPDGAVAIFEPDSGALFARKGVLAVVEQARGFGADILIEAVHNVDYARKRFPAQMYVFACGPWLPKIFPDVLGSMITSTRQELFYFGTPPGDKSFNAWAMPVWLDDVDPRIPYGLPDLDGQGFKMGFHREGAPFDPDRGDRLVYAEQVEEARQYLGRRFPPLANAPLVDSRVCQYENTQTGDFIIDRHPQFDDVWLVGGGSGHGFKHGPAVAEYLYELVESGGPQEPRFALNAHASEGARAVF